MKTRDRKQSRNRTSGRRNVIPKLYRELATWWPLLSSPAEYEEEAAFYHRTLVEACETKPRTLLELGSGGGNNASHLKAHFQMTLVDRSPEMLAVSRKLNPECEHIEGDMRSLRLGRLFDTVFIHDAIMYMTTEADLRRTMETASVHCRSGGAALFVPDHVRETFVAGTDHGGHDGEARSLRYLEWTYPSADCENTYVVEFVCLLRQDDKPVRVEYERHLCGLFARADWLRFLSEAGFAPKCISDPQGHELFVGVKPKVQAIE